MDAFGKKELSETGIRTQYITPAILQAGWDLKNQIFEEYPITAGRIIANQNECKRLPPLKADYVLFYKRNFPIAIVEAKKNTKLVTDGIQQAINYARMMNVPFAFSSNGDGFRFRNLLANHDIETTLSMDQFPSPEKLWNLYQQAQKPTDNQLKVMDEPYYTDDPDKQPRYYQMNAINKTVEAITRGQKRVLLVMATGTGKTYTAFQIIWRLWKAGIKKRILFLADRRQLIRQTKNEDFAPFKDKMTWVTKQNFDTAHEIYLALYQGLTSEDSEDKETDCDDTRSLFKQFSPSFFDLIIVDECHRGSAKANSRWREVLEYFSEAAQIGMTATPKETEDISTTEYFGPPVYTYSLKQGIEDGFLAPYHVTRIFFDKDVDGFTPYDGQCDDYGELIENRTYNTKDFDRTIVLAKRTELVAKTVSDFLKKHGCRDQKAIFFCVDQEHADRLRTALIRENEDLCQIDDRYVMRITSNDEAGVNQLDNFQDVNSPYPTLVTTSKLLTTGVNIKTCHFIVLDANINSMSEFKQIIGRGTRIDEDHGKMFFTIFDFRNVTRKFHDPEFDGEPSGGDYNPKTNPPPPPPPNPNPTPRQKFFLGSEDVQVALETHHVIDESGNIVVEQLVSFTKSEMKNKYATLQDFLAKWSSAERKQAVVEELRKQGILLDELQKAVNKDLDPFDMILHVAYDQPPLTRRERAERVRKRNYFTKYGAQAAAVLEALLDKYAETGLSELENTEVLSVEPLKQFGTPVQIVRLFGGASQYKQAVRDLIKAIYAA